MTARIVRRDERHSQPIAFSNALVIPTARKIELAHALQHEEAKRIRRQAQEEAKRLLEQAHDEAQNIQKQAYEKGLKEGQAQTLGLLMQLRTEQENILKNSLDMIVAAVRAVAERALSQAITTSDLELSVWVREALAPLRGSHQISIHGEHATIARLELYLKNLSSLVNCPIKFIIDPSLPPNKLIAQSNLGEIRIDAHLQVDLLIEALHPTLQHALEEQTKH